MAKTKGTTTVKLGSFGKEVLARLAGDNNEALAQKISRKSMSAVEGQIAAQKASKVDAEMALENAQEAFDDALYPTTYNSNSKVYCEAISRAQSEVDDAQDELDDLTDSIKFYTGLIDRFVDGDA